MWCVVVDAGGEELLLEQAPSANAASRPLATRPATVCSRVHAPSLSRSAFACNPSSGGVPQVAGGTERAVARPSAPQQVEPCQRGRVRQDAFDEALHVRGRPPGCCPPTA